MTGFAAVRRDQADMTVHVTVKSVNHRFLDLAIKAPGVFSAVEARLRALVQERVARGRVELTLVVEATTPPDRDVVVDDRLIDRIGAAMAALADRGAVSGPLTPADVLHIPHAIDIRPAAGFSAAPPPELADLALAAVDEALKALVAMRETEGRHLAADFTERLRTIAGYVDVLEAEGHEGQRQLDAKLRERLDALPADLRGDQAALARELVRFVSRSDIDEELVRMRGHLDHWRGLVEAPEPCGRQLDFLVQEMNREVNTIGSKVESLRATETVIAAKAELERIREQVQNVE
jgi:uncharacterized protein (TIGR00255 family)